MTNTDVTQVANRPKDGTFGAPVPIGSGFLPQVAYDSKGNAIAVWIRSDGTNYRIETSFNSGFPVS